MEDTTNHMEVYAFQKRFIYTETAVIFILAALIIVSWFPTMVSLVAFGVTIKSVLRAAIYLSITSVSFVFFLLLIKKELRSIRIIITDESIIRKTPYKITTIHFNEITKIEFRPMPFMVGVLKITAGSSIVIPCFIENLSNLVETLEKHLTENGISRCFDKASLDTLKLRAGTHDISYGFSQYYFNLIIRMMLACACINLFIAYGYWDFEYLPLLIWTISGFAFPIFAYGLADFLIKRKKGLPIRQNDRELVQNYKNEFLTGCMIVFVVYLITGILFKTFYPW